jgi:hypothetical protein
MKKIILNPHLAVIAFVTLIVMGSASVASAQVDRKISQSIIIKNGDTTINGKKLNEVDQEERIRLRQVFRDMEGRIKGKTIDKRVIIKPGESENSEIIIGRQGDVPHILHWEDDDMKELDFNDKMPGGLHVFKFNGDSSMSFDFNTDTIMKQFRFQIDGLDSNLRKRIITMHGDMAPVAPNMPRMRRMPRSPMNPSAPPMVFEFERGELPGMRNRNNSSSFNFNSTDKNGISSRMNFRLSEAEKSQVKTITGIENNGNLLDIKDLTLFPNFSNGKVGISFNLESKGSIKLKILNTDLKPVFTDEISNFNGSYMKQISLPENGFYYISINQNNVWYVKQIVKE